MWHGVFQFGGSEAIITALSDEFPVLRQHRELFVLALFVLYFFVGLASCAEVPPHWLPLNARILTNSQRRSVDPARYNRLIAFYIALSGTLTALFVCFALLPFSFFFLFFIFSYKA